MHEQVIAKNIIREAKRHGTVTGIEIHVGELAHIPAKDLEEAMSLLTDWQIDVVQTPGQVKCTCGFAGRPVVIEKGHDHTIFACPKCEKRFPKVIAGDQIIIVGVDVEE